MHQHRNIATRLLGMTLPEVLISSGILAALVAAGVVMSTIVTDSGATNLTLQSLSQDARIATNVLRDDLGVISRDGSLSNPDDHTSGFRSDPNRPNSIQLALTETPSNQELITYYITGTTLYRTDALTTTPLALNATSLAVTITDDDQVTFTLTLERNDVTKTHEIHGRFKNP